MAFQCINICQVPREVLKTPASSLGYQHLPRDLANVNAWKMKNHVWSLYYWGSQAWANSVDLSQMQQNVKSDWGPCRLPLIQQFLERTCSNFRTSYSQTLLARTSLGPWKFVWDMGSLSHWGLIIIPGQKANGDDLGNCFLSSIQKWYVECTH